MLHSVIDMAGQTFGWLTVLRREGSTRKRGIKKYACWLCRCTCGQEVVVTGQNLRRGLRKACCVNGHVWALQKYGGLPTKYKSEYASWQSMHARCENPKVRSYKNYGARGIEVCARWLSFASFMQDMGPKPTVKHSIDRYPDNNGNYEPSNCRWATDSEQRRNARDNIYVEYEGERMLLVALLERLGLDRAVVAARLTNGWTLEDALQLPVRPKVKNGQKKLAPSRISSIKTQWD